MIETLMQVVGLAAIVGLTWFFTREHYRKRERQVAAELFGAGFRAWQDLAEGRGVYGPDNAEIGADEVKRVQDLFSGGLLSIIDQMDQFRSDHRFRQMRLEVETSSVKPPQLTWSVKDSRGLLMRHNRRIDQVRTDHKPLYPRWSGLFERLVKREEARKHVETP